MAIFAEYGNGQRIGFALICVGFILCLAASCAPNWLKAEVPAGKVFIGLWSYCVEAILIGEKCTSFYNSTNWIDAVRSFVVFNFILGFVSMCAACCRCLCCTGGRTICHGVFAGCAAVCGFIAAGIFSSNTKFVLSIQVVNVNYDWAYAIYIIGCILMAVSAFLLCCARPRESYPGMIMAPQAGVQVQVSQSTSNTFNSGPPARSFEPLPYPLPGQMAAQPPQAAAYGVPPAPAYGVPPAPAYGVPPAPAYGVPPAPAYGAPPAPAYGVAPAPAYGVAPAPKLME